MWTIKKARENLKKVAAKDSHVNIIRGTVAEILVDLDGDKRPDVGLLDTTGDGLIDTLALDLLGDNHFDLYFADTDHNQVPDIIYLDENGQKKVVNVGEDMQTKMSRKASEVYRVLTDEYSSEEDLLKALVDLRDLVQIAKKQFKK